MLDLWNGLGRTIAFSVGLAGMILTAGRTSGAVTFTFDYIDFQRNPPGGRLAELGAISGTSTAGGTQLVLSGHFGTSAVPVPFDLYSQLYTRGQQFGWSGMMEGDVMPGDNFSVAYDFTISSTGGAVEWYMMFLAHAGDYIPGVGIPYFAQADRLEEVVGTQRVQGVLQAPFNGPGPGDDWQLLLDIDWFGAKPGDTMYIDIPGDTSFDVVVAPVPEPGAVGVLAAGAAGLFVRRGRRRASH